MALSKQAKKYKGYSTFQLDWCTYLQLPPHTLRLLKYICSTLDILFSSNHNIHKSLRSLCFWASDPLIDRFYKNHSIKVSEA